MSTSHRKRIFPPNSRSEAQQYGSAAMAYVMQSWEALTDPERLSWDSHASPRRMTRVNLFKLVNLRRTRRGEEVSRKPPVSQVWDGEPLVKELRIEFRKGCLVIRLRLARTPETPRSVWASLPCSRGRKQPRSCPRLGWLPKPRDGWCDISALYFAKYGEYLRRHGIQLIGKRIFVRVRPETDDGPNLHEQVKAIVPDPGA
jgi:hypothetical protein